MGKYSRQMWRLVIFLIIVVVVAVVADLDFSSKKEIQLIERERKENVSLDDQIESNRS